MTNKEMKRMKRMSVDKSFSARPLRLGHPTTSSRRMGLHVLKIFFGFLMKAERTSTVCAKKCSVTQPFAQSDLLYVKQCSNIKSALGTPYTYFGQFSRLAS